MHPSAIPREPQRSRCDHSPTMCVPINSDVDIVVARQRGKALAGAMRFSATDLAFIATTVSELARALLARTVRGEISLHRIDEPRRTGVLIVAHDPTIRDCLRGSGSRNISELGLPAVDRLVDEFRIDGVAGHGTTITATKWCSRGRTTTGG